jgi:metal-sulfur cluster biosynthetic enzyme
MIQKTTPEKLRLAILESLAGVIDPETGADVVRMRLIEDLAVDEAGRISCKFRPSSPFCPLAVPLSQSIHEAIAAVEGVTQVNVEIVGLVLSDELMEMLRQAYGPRGGDDEGVFHID